MTDHTEHERDQLSEEELERAEGETLPDREAMSLITPNVSHPPITVPVEPSE